MNNENIVKQIRVHFMWVKMLYVSELRITRIYTWGRGIFLIMYLQSVRD